MNKLKKLVSILSGQAEDKSKGQMDLSLTKDGNGTERISPEIESNIIVKDYAHDIYDWVCKLPNLLPENEEFLHSAILQVCHSL